MLDDDRDKEMMRNQMIAIVLMTLLVVMWFQFYAPKPAPPETAPPQTVAEDPAAPRRTASAQEITQQEESQEAAQTGWPYLPPIYDNTTPVEDVVLEDGYLRLVFTPVGARLKEAYVLLGDNGDNSIQLVPEMPDDVPVTEASYPMGLEFSHEALGSELDRRLFQVERANTQSVVFSLRLPGASIVRKTFSLGARPYVVDTQVAYENLETTPRILGMDQTPAFSLSWGPNVESSDRRKMVKQAVCWRADGLIENQVTAKMDSDAAGRLFTKVMPAVEWVAIKSAYFMVALKSETQETPRSWIEGDEERFRIGLDVPRFEVASGETNASAFSIYIGPSQRSSLAKAWPTLPEGRRFFQSVDAMDWFAKLLLGLMNWFHDHIIANYGFAIFFVTLLARIVMYPLTLKSMRSMKKMQLLAPEIEALKEKYGSDPQEMNKKMMELYRERGVNPMGGCFPMLLQLPVFIALYRMLSSAFELRGAPFILWIKDLSEPDQLFQIPQLENLPLIGMFATFNLLPILMGLAMVINQKLMPTSGPSQNPQQKFIMTFMPIFFSFICYSMASGLNLYILTSTLLGIVQQKFTHASAEDIKPQKKKTPRKRQHFYTAATRRKRELAREAKHARKTKATRADDAKAKKKGKRRS